MRILIITDRPPFPVMSGASLRVYNLLRRVAAKHDVWLAALTTTPEQSVGVEHLREICTRVETAEIRPAGALARPAQGLRYLLEGRPPDLRFHWSGELARKIHQLAATVAFDIVQIEFGHMGLYLDVLPREVRKRSIWMLHDIDWSKYGRISQLESKPARKLRAWVHGSMMRLWKPSYAARFGRCVTVSEDDRRLLTAANPVLRVDVVPNGVDTRAFQLLAEGSGGPALLFVGNMDYLPCVDAVVFYCRDVLPRIRHVMPDVEMWIVGPNPRPEVRALEGAGIHVTGLVDDLRPYYGRSTVCVVPLRAGGGTRLKILEAMALGRPVVSTSIGCEGLGLVDAEHLLIADSIEQLATQTLRLLSDRFLRQSITNRARDLVVRRYDWDILAKSLGYIYAELAMQLGKQPTLA